jgi:hypothetical protein
MPGDPHNGSKVWEAPDREIGKPGENCGKVVAHRDFQPAAAFASSCFSFAIVAAVESFRLPDLWRRFRLVAACPFAMYPPKVLRDGSPSSGHGIYLTRHCILALECRSDRSLFDQRSAIL